MIHGIELQGFEIRIVSSSQLNR